MNPYPPQQNPYPPGMQPMPQMVQGQSQAQPWMAAPPSIQPSESWDDYAVSDRDKGFMLKGLGVMLSSGCFFFLGFKGYLLAVKGIPLPSWAFYVLGAIVALGGLAMVVFADRRLCKKCNQPIETRDAYFPLQAEQVVLGAVRSGNPGALFQLPMVPKNQMKMVVTSNCCTGCGTIAEISASKWQDYREHSLIGERFIHGHPATGFSQLVKQHSEWRGEED